MVSSRAPPTWPTPTSPRVTPCQIQTPQALGKSPLRPPALQLMLSRPTALQPQVQSIPSMLIPSHLWLKLVSGVTPVKVACPCELSSTSSTTPRIIPTKGGARNHTSTINFWCTVEAAPTVCAVCNSTPSCSPSRMMRMLTSDHDYMIPCY